MSPSGSTSPVRPVSPSRQVLMQPDNLVIPDGVLDESTAELLDELVHPHHQADDTLVDVDCVDNKDTRSTATLPWWRRPSPWWLMTILPLMAMSSSAVIGPRIEVYTILACSVHKPDVFNETYRDSGLEFPGRNLNQPTLLSLPLPLTVSTYLNIPSWSGTFGNTDARSQAVSWQGISSLAVNSTDPPKGKPHSCASDPIVQAAVAKLAAVMTAAMGVLSCITTSWWGSLSDRHGRTRVLGIWTIAAVVTDFNFIFVSTFSRRLPGGYWLLVFGPVIEGIVGGVTAALASMHAYIADTTTEATRSRTMSLAMGLFFSGMAFGPTLGALLIHYTHTPLSVYWVAGFTDIAFSLYVWFVIPESLPKEKMVQFRDKYKQDLADAAYHRERNPAVGLLVRIKNLFTFMSPLSIFFSDIKGRGSDLCTPPTKTARKNWPLTLLALSYGIVLTVGGSYTYKFQYAAATFGWTSEEIGYWLSLLGAVRALFLTLILPVTIKIFQSRALPKPSASRTSSPHGRATSAEREPLLSGSRSPHNYAGNESATAKATNSDAPAAAKHSLAFDLGLVRVSLLLETMSYILMGLAPNALWFTIFGMLGALGAGFGPAMQSLVLAMYVRGGGEEVGKLYGAMGVIQAVCMQILGPAVFGLVYMRTVATFPRAIFFVSVATGLLAFICLACVRLPAEHPDTPNAEDEEDCSTQVRAEGNARDGRDATLVDVGPA